MSISGERCVRTIWHRYKIYQQGLIPHSDTSNNAMSLFGILFKNIIQNLTNNNNVFVPEKPAALKFIILIQLRGHVVMYKCFLLVTSHQSSPNSNANLIAVKFT